MHGRDSGRAPFFLANHLSVRLAFLTSFPDSFDSANKPLATLSIDRRTGKISGGAPLRPETFQKVHEISSPAGFRPVIDGERLYVY